MSLASVQRFRVSREHVAQTDLALRRAGADGYELFVLWSGQVSDPGTCTINTVHIPKQSSLRTPTGLLVRVDGDELHRLNKWLHEHGEAIVAQVHAHPTDAYHSTTDDTYPIVTTDGGLSIVVPEFGADGLLANGTVVYRLRQMRWVEVTADLIQVC